MLSLLYKFKMEAGISFVVLVIIMYISSLKSTVENFEEEEIERDKITEEFKETSNEFHEENQKILDSEPQDMKPLNTSVGKHKGKF